MPEFVHMKRGDEDDFVPDFAVKVRRDEGWVVVKATADEKKADQADKKESS